jgi:phosphoserine phosphatase
MTQIILVRHGHVLGIAPERFRGRTELELTGRGRAQARATARYIEHQWDPVAIWASPMERCQATAQEIGRVCSAPVSVLEELNDLDYGDWSNREHSEISRLYPDLYRQWKEAPDLVQFPGGESLQRRAEEIASALRFVLERYSNDTVVLVGHESSNRVLLLQVLQLPLSAYWSLWQDPGAVSEVRLEGARRAVICMNETAHLEPIGTVGRGDDNSSP